MGIESGRRKIINHDFVQGQGNPPSFQSLQIYSQDNIYGGLNMLHQNIYVAGSSVFGLNTCYFDRPINWTNDNEKEKKIQWITH